MDAPDAAAATSSAFVAERLSVGDRLDVLATRSRQVTSIDDAPVVAAICDALVRLPDPWTHPSGGMPVAPLRFDFYRGADFVGSLGVARSFLVAQVAGGFTCYGLDDERVEAELCRLVGLDRRPRKTEPKQKLGRAGGVGSVSRER